MFPQWKAFLCYVVTKVQDEKQIIRIKSEIFPYGRVVKITENTALTYYTSSISINIYTRQTYNLYQRDFARRSGKVEDGIDNPEITATHWGHSERKIKEKAVSGAVNSKNNA